LPTNPAYPPCLSLPQAFLDDPITQAAAYQFPVCNYQDPLRGVGSISDLLAWDVTVAAQLCLQVGCWAAGLLAGVGQRRRQVAWRG
jgi:hypothetical protein